MNLIIQVPCYNEAKTSGVAARDSRLALVRVGVERRHLGVTRCC